MFLAYLKFGFSRATTDASIAIRLGYMSRQKKEEKLLKNMTTFFPHEHLGQYLKYFKLNKKEFFLKF